MKSLRSKEHRALSVGIAAARQKVGLTQAQLAAKLNKPQSFVAKIEGGERRVDVVEFIRLAKALGVAPEVLLTRVLS